MAIRMSLYPLRHRRDWRNRVSYRPGVISTLRHRRGRLAEVPSVGADADDRYVDFESDQHPFRNGAWGLWAMGAFE